MGWSLAGHMRSGLVMDTLKNEMLQGGCFINKQDASIKLFSYIESCYNHHRKHSALSYLSPAQFEAKIANLN